MKAEEWEEALVVGSMIWFLWAVCSATLREEEWAQRLEEEMADWSAALWAEAWGEASVEGSAGGWAPQWAQGLGEEMACWSLIASRAEVLEGRLAEVL